MVDEFGTNEMRGSTEIDPVVRTIRRIVKLSGNETKLWGLLPPKGVKITTAELMEKFYGARVPLNGRISILNIVRQIKRKNLSGFKLATSDRSGPHPIEVWKA
jgi:hypothetical protein